MSYDSQERSFQDGKPIELYEFQRGERIWRFTSAPFGVTILGNDWEPATLKRGSIETNPEMARNALKLQCAREFEIADLYRVTAPTEVVLLYVRRYHRTDGTVALIWAGRVLNVQWKGSEASMNCEPISSSVRRIGLRRLYQKGCPHVLYSEQPGCGLDRETQKIETTVTAVDGLVLTVAALLAKPYAGGYVEWEAEAGVIERRFIRSFTGLELTLTQPFQGIAPPNLVTVFPGCDHTMETCDEYGNLPNYGGFPYIPTKNPFDGTPVY